MLSPIRIAYQRFTSCSGCQLTLLNCEQELPHWASILQVVDFAMASSAVDDGGPLDLALAEGSISTPEQLRQLLQLRRRARLLVAVGACALSGGVNSLAGSGPELERLSQGIFGQPAVARETFPAQPIGRFVAVDLELPGCPPEGRDYLALIGALRAGGRTWQPGYPVCMECRLRDNLCLLIEARQPCLGPVTRAGCAARCPSAGVVCEGCRGWVAEANRDEQFRLLLDLGLSEGQIAARMQRFAGRGDENADR